MGAAGADIDAAAAGRCLRLDLRLVVVQEDEQAPLGPRVLNRGAHERVNQFLQDDLARHRLRDFDNDRQIELFDPCPDGARQSGRWLILPEVRI